MIERDEWKQEGVPWDDASELWELQTGPRLTVGTTVEILSRVDPSLPVQVTVYDGTDRPPVLHPVEVGYVGDGERPAALMLTVTRLDG